MRKYNFSEFEDNEVIAELRYTEEDRERLLYQMRGGALETEESKKELRNYDAMITELKYELSKRSLV